MREKGLRYVNDEAVRLGLVSQEDADLCTRYGRSLEYMIEAHKEKNRIGKEEYMKRIRRVLDD